MDNRIARHRSAGERGRFGQAGPETRDLNRPPLEAKPALNEPPPQGGVAFSCRDLFVEFDSGAGPRRVLEKANFDVGAGEFVSVMGRSGTGKTTLLRVLGGLLASGSGSTVLHNGGPVDGPPEGVVTVFQNYAASLLPWRTVEGNVALGIEGKMAKQQVKARVGECLGMVGLGEYATEYPWRLSGGMQQRVQLARALAIRPSVLLMDEPFGALDAITKASLQDELQHVYQHTNPTVVFVTHDIDEAIYLSDRILVLEGTPATIGHRIDVGLPRPREQLASRELPEFLKLRRMVHEAITTGDEPGRRMH